MALFGGPRNYASIVAPLQKMVSDLASYVAEQTKKIENLEIEKAQIEADIDLANSEIMKSNFTTTKINDLLGSDIDQDGIPDVDELPVDGTDVLDIEPKE